MSTMLLPVPLLLLAAACGIEIARDLALKRYAQAIGGLLWGLIFLVATVMSAGPLMTLLASRG